MSRPSQARGQQVPESDDYGHWPGRYGRGRRHRGGYDDRHHHPHYYHDERRRPILQIGDKNGYAEDDYGRTTDYNGFDDADEPGYANNIAPQQKQQTRATVNTNENRVQSKCDHFASMADIDLQKPAKFQTQTVVFEASREYTPSQFFDSNGNLKADGKLIFSASKNHLKPIRATCQADVYGVTPSDVREDLVSEVELKIWGNYNKKLLISIPTIGALEGEHFREAADHVNFTVPANTLALDKPYILTYNRDDVITNGTLAFANSYKSTSPDVMDKDIAHVNGRGISYVPWNHSIMHYYNMDHANDGLAVFEEPPADMKGDVIIQTKDVMTYLAYAKQSVAKVVSLGNVTNAPQIVIEACEPQERINMASRLSENGAAALPKFTGLADAMCYYGKAYNEEKQVTYMNKLFNFEMVATFKYAKLGKGPIKPAK